MSTTFFCTLNDICVKVMHFIKECFSISYFIIQTCIIYNELMGTGTEKIINEMDIKYRIKYLNFKQKPDERIYNHFVHDLPSV